MMRLSLTLPSLQFLLLASCLLFPACSSVEHAGTTFKTGMHIDAVLECAVEYPLLWTKDRRLSYGSKNGEIYWKPPEADGTLLRLTSQQQRAIDPAQQLSHLLQEFTDLEISLREKVTLPAGEATHITANNAEQHLEIYQFSNSNRSYLLSLTMLRENLDRYSGIMNEVIDSFQILQ